MTVAGRSAWGWCLVFAAYCLLLTAYCFLFFNLRNLRIGSPSSRSPTKLCCRPVDHGFEAEDLRVETSYWLPCLTGRTQTTKLNFSPRYWPVISQQPGVGTYTPDSMDPEPALGPIMCVIGARRRGGASPSRRLPVSVKFGRGSFCQS